MPPPGPGRGMARGAPPRPVFKPQSNPVAAGRGRGRGAQPAGAASSDSTRKRPGASQKPQRPSVNVNPFGNAAGAAPAQ